MDIKIHDRMIDLTNLSSTEPELKSIGKDILMKHNYFLPTREEIHEGKKTLVVPVVMMVEGVHHGSAGPMFYSREELAYDPHVWNGVPVPILHPVEDGQPISANSPKVIEERNAGRIYNSKWEDGKLKGEVWLDIVKAELIWPGIVNMILSGMPIDVSTGLFSTDEMIKGNWNGEEYEGVVRNIKPDHLAILPGQTGACSWADGCGIRMNNQGEGGESVEKDHSIGILEKAGELIKSALAPSKSVSGGEGSKMKQILSTLRDILEPKRNAVSDDEIRRQIQRSIDKLDTPEIVQPGIIHFVVSVFSEGESKFFIYEERAGGMNSEPSKFFKQEYQVEGDAVTLKGSPVEVREEFVAASQNINQVKEEENMDKKDRITGLIASAGIFAGMCGDILMAMDDKVIDHLIAINEKVMAREKDLTTQIQDLSAKITKAPENMEETIALAPEGIQNQIREGISMLTSAKADLIKTLRALEGCPYSEEDLQKKEMKELGDLVAFASKTKVNFAGRGGAPITDNKGAGPATDGTGVPPTPDLVKILQEKKAG